MKCKDCRYFVQEAFTNHQTKGECTVNPPTVIGIYDPTKRSTVYSSRRPIVHTDTEPCQFFVRKEDEKDN